MDYDGVGKPPFCEIIFKAVSAVSTPPDFTATIVFGDFSKPTNKFTISRAAEIPPESQLNNRYNNLISLPTMYMYYCCRVPT